MTVDTIMRNSNKNPANLGEKLALLSFFAYAAWALLPAVYSNISAKFAVLFVFLSIVGMFLDTNISKLKFLGWMMRYFAAGLFTLFYWQIGRKSYFTLAVYMSQGIMVWYPMVLFLYLRSKKSLELNKYVFFILILLVGSTCITTIFGLQKYPNASRLLAGGVVPLEKVVYENSNIGGYGFIYSITLVYPVLLGLHAKLTKSLHKVAYALFLAIIVVTVLFSQYQTAVYILLYVGFVKLMSMAISLISRVTHLRVHQFIKTWMSILVSMIIFVSLFVQINQGLKTVYSVLQLQQLSKRAESIIGFESISPDSQNGNAVFLNQTVVLSADEVETSTIPELVMSPSNSMDNNIVVTSAADESTDSAEKNETITRDNGNTVSQDQTVALSADEVETSTMPELIVSPSNSTNGNVVVAGAASEPAATSHINSTDNNETVAQDNGNPDIQTNQSRYSKPSKGTSAAMIEVATESKKSSNPLAARFSVYGRLLNSVKNNPLTGNLFGSNIILSGHSEVLDALLGGGALGALIIAVLLTVMFRFNIFAKGRIKNIDKDGVLMFLLIAGFSMINTITYSREITLLSFCFASLIDKNSELGTPGQAL